MRRKIIRILKNEVKNGESASGNHRDLGGIFYEESVNGHQRLGLVVSNNTRKMKIENTAPDNFHIVGFVNGRYVLHMPDTATRELREYANTCLKGNVSLDLSFDGRGMIEKRYNGQKNALIAAAGVTALVGGLALAAVFDILNVMPFPVTALGVLVGAVLGLNAISNYKRNQLYDMRDALEKLIKKI